jgi:hypothetical protein
MRSLSEAKLHGPDRNKIEIEFLKRFNFMLPHYFNQICSSDCPCKNLETILISPSLKISSEESQLFLGDKDGTIIKKILMSVNDETFLSTQCVCQHWYFILILLIIILSKVHNNLL